MGTPEQKAAYINARTACMLAEMNGMIAENNQHPENQPYGEKQFNDLELRYHLDENSLTEYCFR
jgi:hypothetical protein